MTISTTSNQVFLELIYIIQNSDASNLKIIADKILNQKVYRKYDSIKEIYIYSLSHDKENIIKNLGGRPRSLTDEQIKEIRSLKDTNLSNEEIAKKFKVSEKTIRNALK